MEKPNYLPITKVIQNTYSTDMLVISPDFPGLTEKEGGITLPPNCIFQPSFAYPLDLKLREQRWTTDEGVPVTYLTLVDKDF